MLRWRVVVSPNASFDPAHNVEVSALTEESACENAQAIVRARFNAKTIYCCAALAPEPGVPH